MVIDDKKVLYQYIFHRYSILNKKDDLVSSIRPSEFKLQKIGYLLYSTYLYRAFINNRIINTTPCIKTDLFIMDETLFDSNFYAGSTGIFDDDIHNMFHKNSFIPDEYILDDLLCSMNKKDNSITYYKDLIINLIDDIIRQVLEINDFTLLDLCLEEKLWIDKSTKAKSKDRYISHEELKDLVLTDSTMLGRSHE